MTTTPDSGQLSGEYRISARERYFSPMLRRSLPRRSLSLKAKILCRGWQRAICLKAQSLAVTRSGWPRDTLKISTLLKSSWRQKEVSGTQHMLRALSGPLREIESRRVLSTGHISKHLQMYWSAPNTLKLSKRCVSLSVCCPLILMCLPQYDTGRLTPSHPCLIAV